MKRSIPACICIRRCTSREFVAVDVAARAREVPKWKSRLALQVDKPATGVLENSHNGFFLKYTALKIGKAIRVINLQKEKMRISISNKIMGKYLFLIIEIVFITTNRSQCIVHTKCPSVI